MCYNTVGRKRKQLTAFLVAFGAINLLTPVVLLSNDSVAQRFSGSQRLIMRRMVQTGVCVLFIGLIMLVV